jgi:hypothetical protein
MRQLIIAMLLAAVVLVLPGRLWCAQVTPAEASKGAASGQELEKAKGNGASIPLDKLKVPPNGIVIVVPSLGHAGQIVPDYIVLPPSTYQELKQAKEELDRKKAVTDLRPARCELTGRIKGNFVYIKAEFTLVTFRPNTSVLLGLQGASFDAVEEMDGQIPYLRPSPEGWTVQIPKPVNNAKLILQFQVRLQTRKQESAAGGTEESFTLKLPGASITRLSLSLPKTIKEIQLNGSADTNPEANGDVRVWNLLLGEVREARISWARPAAQPRPASAPTAQWKVSVQILEHQAVTSARLTLDDSRAETTQWRLLLPPGAQVDIPGDSGPLYTKEVDDKTGLTLLKGPPAAQLVVVVTVTHKRPFGRMPVGPFLVIGAVRQQGVFDVRAAREALVGQVLRFHPAVQPPVRQQDTADESAKRDLVARFHCWDLTQGMPPGRPAGGKSLAKITPPLELELKAVTAAVATAVEHTVMLESGEGGRRVVVVSKIHGTPLQSGVDFLDVRLPQQVVEIEQAFWALAGISQSLLPVPAADVLLRLWQDARTPVRSPSITDYQPILEPATLVEFRPLPGQSKIRLYLHQLQVQKFTVVLKGTYPLAPDAGQVRLALPRPISPVDHGAAATIEVREDQELVLPSTFGEQPRKQQATLHWNRAPAFVQFAWKPYHPEVPINIVADLTMGARHAAVRQELNVDLAQFPSPATENSPVGAARQLTLLVPAGVLDLAVKSGGALVAREGDRAMIALGARGPLVLEWTFPLQKARGGRPDKGAGNEKKSRAAVPVPLIWPDGDFRTQAQVRIWGNPGMLPDVPVNIPGNEFWHDEPPANAIPGKDVDPVWVLRTTHARAPLTMVLEDPSLFGPENAAPLVDRVLVQVLLKENGSREYVTRYHIRRVNGRYLDLVFGVPVRRLDRLVVILGGRRQDWQEQEAGGKVARVVVRPNRALADLMLEIRYELSAENSEDGRFGQTILQPPHFRGDSASFALHNVCWQVMLPGSHASLLLENSTPWPQRWIWQSNFLLRPEPDATTADLEYWLTGRRRQENAAVHEPPMQMVFRTDTLRPVAFWMVPQALWLLLCSGLVVALGLGMLFHPWLRRATLVVMVLLAMALVSVGIAWPLGLLAFIYGAEPGLAVLVLVLLVQWVLQRRYQRQVVFLPGFTRLKTSSSLAPAAKAPSTVDAPRLPARPSGSSQRTGKERPA